jgi:uncharacterized DUF497 family protein
MFEWDEDKRLINLAKHKLDFVDAGLIFDGRPTVTAASAHPFEERLMTTSLIAGKSYTVVWTWRDPSPPDHFIQEGARRRRKGIPSCTQMTS